MIADKIICMLRYYHLPGPGDTLEPGGDIHRITDNGVVHTSRPSQIPCDERAGVYADTYSQTRRLTGKKLSLRRVDLFLDLQCTGYGRNGIILL